MAPGLGLALVAAVGYYIGFAPRPQHYIPFLISIAVSALIDLWLFVII
jgi:hypothetical protein